MSHLLQFIASFKTCRKCFWIKIFCRWDIRWIATICTSKSMTFSWVSLQNWGCLTQWSICKLILTQKMAMASYGMNFISSFWRLFHYRSQQCSWASKRPEKTSRDYRVAAKKTNHQEVFQLPRNTHKDGWQSTSGSEDDGVDRRVWKSSFLRWWV